jgi:signal peptidase I
VADVQRDGFFLAHILRFVSNTRRLIFGRNPKRTIVRIAVLVVVSFVTFGWVLTPTRVRGISMLPTYQDATLNLVNRLTYKVRSPARGDVVAIRLAGPSVVYVKRIIGLPSERVAIVEGNVEINGAPLVETYVQQRQPWNYAEITVGPGEYFVIGDNRTMRMADHDFGRVDARRILGKLVF